METHTVSACMLIIGNEILSGRIQDTNLSYLAQALNDLGVRLKEARVIPDVERVIVDSVNDCRKRFDLVFTTGGIGPTHDDITAACVAKAFGVELETHPEIAERIERADTPPDVTERRLRMAMIPHGSALIENPTGGPQGFQIENVYVMAGIPGVMQAMVSTFDRCRLQGADSMLSRYMAIDIGESEIVAELTEIQARHPDMEIGVYPIFQDGIESATVVIRGTSASALEVVMGEIRSAIEEAGGQVDA